MGATEEQLQLVHDLGSDHSAYILVVSAAAFTIFSLDSTCNNVLFTISWI